MYRKLMFLISLVTLLAFSNGTFADFTWDGGGVGDSFCTPENWDTDSLPGPSDDLRMEYRSDGKNLAVVDCVLEVDELRIADGGLGTAPTIVNIVSGGNLTLNSQSRVGDVSGGAEDGELHLSGTGILRCHGTFRLMKEGHEGWLTIADDAYMHVGTSGTSTELRTGDKSSATSHVDISGGTLIIEGKQWRWGNDGAGTVTISGGSVNSLTNDGIRFQAEDSYQLITISGGEIYSADHLDIGEKAKPTGGSQFNMSGGIINSGDVRVHRSGGSGDVEVNVSGGLMISRGTFQLGNLGSPAGNNQVNLSGGTIEAADLNIAAAGANFNITDTGTLILDGNKISKVYTLGFAGLLTACPGGDVQGLLVDYNVTNPGKTTVTAMCDYDVCQAWGPVPAEGADKIQSVETDVVLSWIEGDCIGPQGRNGVYFGTDPVVVDNATNSDPEWKGFQLAGVNTYNAGNLPLWESRYWRIDEYNTDFTITKGNVWSFTTGCEAIPGDFNMDCLVNFLDYADFASTYSEEEFWPE